MILVVEPGQTTSALPAQATLPRRARRPRTGRKRRPQRRRRLGRVPQAPWSVHPRVAKRRAARTRCSLVVARGGVRRGNERFGRRRTSAAPRREGTPVRARVELSEAIADIGLWARRCRQVDAAGGAHRGPPEVGATVTTVSPNPGSRARPRRRADGRHRRGPDSSRALTRARARHSSAPRAPRESSAVSSMARRASRCRVGGRPEELAGTTGARERPMTLIVTKLDCQSAR